MAPQALIPAPTVPGRDDLEDIQGIVYSGWRSHPFAGYLFARLGDEPARARAWLAELAPRVTSAAHHTHPPHGRLQVALAPAGLAALGVPAEVLAALPQETLDGMARRWRRLGDPRPETWALGGPAQRLDVLVMVFARDADAREAMLARERAALTASGADVYADELAWPMLGKEHFGFADGLSQPFVPGPYGEPRHGQQPVATGEMLLGYVNAYDRTPQSPRRGDVDLGRNGTYLVFRKLRQHVGRFWGWLAAQADEVAARGPGGGAALTELLAAKVVGRWPSGAPLVLAPEADDPRLAIPERRNDFGYLALDPDGLRCPIASHVRRANPRDARGGSAADSADVVKRHRILRRGRPYGAPLPDDVARRGQDDGAPRGLYFVSLQASIARGFEFVQQTWLSNRGFHGLAGEPDPLTAGGDETAHVTIPADPLRLRLAGPPRVVELEGGGYFFLPSRAALARLARGP